MRFVNCQLTHRGRDFCQLGNFGRVFGQSASRHNQSIIMIRTMEIDIWESQSTTTVFLISRNQ